MTAAIDHALVSADMAELEASDLRVQLRLSEQKHIVSVWLTYRYFCSLGPLFERLRKFSQITQHEIDHHYDCLKSDHDSLTRMVDNFKKRWGMAPIDDKGCGIVVPDAPKGRGLATRFKS